MRELEKKLDKEVNKTNFDRFVVEDVCNEILSDKNCSTNTIKKIYEYIKLGMICPEWGSFPSGKLYEHKNSPFKILTSNTNYKRITDILFISLNGDPEIYSSIIKYLQSNKCKSVGEVRKTLFNLMQDKKEMKSLSKIFGRILPFHARFMPFYSETCKDMVLQNIGAMRNHLRAGYNLFSKIDELLIGLKPPLLYYSEYDYWRIVQDIRRLCSECKDKKHILLALHEGMLPIEISNLALSGKAGFFSRVFFPRFYRELWRGRAGSVCSDIIEHINKDA